MNGDRCICHGRGWLDTLVIDGIPGRVTCPRCEAGHRLWASLNNSDRAEP